MKKETIITVLGTLVGVFIILMVIGLTSKEEVITPVEVQSVYKDSFVEGCAESGDATYTQCSCMYDTILKNRGTEGMAEMSSAYIKTGNISDEVVEMIMPCIN